MFESGRVTIGSVRGIAIRVHRSWIIIALLIAWSLYSRFALGDTGLAVTIVMATVATLLFFFSVLVHELAHSLEAQHRGVEVRGITLFLFGGATETSFDVERPIDEFALTAVGPFSSLVLGGGFGLLAYYSSRAGIQTVAQVAGTLAWVNVALAVFNLLPGAPLDGGRILRAAVWKVTGDRPKAVRVASWTGQVLGYLIAGVGLLQLFFVRGGFLGGIWLAFIGWFLAQAAKSERVRQELTTQLSGLTVGELVTDEPLPTIASDVDLATAADRLRRRPEDALAVERDGATVAILLVSDVAEVAVDERASRRVADVARPLDELRTIPAGTEVSDTLQAMGSDQPLVVRRGGEGGDVVGVITPDRLRQVLKRTRELGAPPRANAHEEGHIPGGGA